MFDENQHYCVRCDLFHPEIMLCRMLVCRTEEPSERPLVTLKLSTVPKEKREIDLKRKRERERETEIEREGDTRREIDREREREKEEQRERERERGEYTTRESDERNSYKK